MPKTRSKSTKITASVTRRVNYKEDSDTSDDDHDDPSLLTNILGFLMNMQRRSAQKKNKKKSPGQVSKRRQRSDGCECPNCTITTPKRRCSRNRPKGRGKAHTSTNPTVNTTVNLESDDEEIVGANITETHVDTIKNKVDTFFKALDSDDDELETFLGEKHLPSPPRPAEKKNKDYYTILSDSEDEKEKPSTSADYTSPVSEPSTSGLSTFVDSGLKQFSHTLNKPPEKKPEDLFSYVDDILNDCNIVDITNDRPKENVPVESLEDLKKKTEEILGSVTSLIDDLKPKPKESEKKVPDSPRKEAPLCPVCLETLGAGRQAMATFCGHMFCGTCIAHVAKTTKKCPTCRKGVTKTKYHPVYL